MNAIAASSPTVKLKGADRVAALLLAMGKPLASQLMAHLNQDEILMVTRAIADLRPISAEQLEVLISDFADGMVKGPHVMGNPAQVAALLEGVLPPEKVSEIMGEMEGRANQSIWDRVSNVSDTNLTAYIMREHPQTAAVILSRLRPPAAAKVMQQLPERFRNEITRRMLTVKPVVDETMKLVERTIYEDFMMNFSRNMGADTHARMADIINKMDREQMESVLTNLADTHPKSAEVLKGLLFTFDDITKLAPRARTALFDQMDASRIVLALKGTNPEFRDIILSSMASRTRRMVEQELTSGEPAAQRDVLEARRSITDLALDMAARGEIELNSGEDEGDFIM